MKHFDKDGDGTVDRSEFLIQFFKRVRCAAAGRAAAQGGGGQRAREAEERERLAQAEHKADTQMAATFTRRRRSARSTS